MKKLIAQFFDDYARRFNEVLKGGKPDLEATAGSFASCFVEASPAGIRCSNDEQFREAIPKGFAFYYSIGMLSMHIGSKVITELDDHHAMVKIHWQSLFAKKDGSREEIGFDVHYFVQVKEEGVKIFAYTTGDERQLLKDRGLEPYR